MPFVVVDTTFFSANLLKLFEGAWVPLLFGVAMAVTIWTWRRGAAILVAKTRRTEVPLKDLIKSLEKRPPHIVKGTAVFLTSDPNFVPTALLHNLKHNKVLHEHNVILTIETAQTPGSIWPTGSGWRPSATNSPSCGCASASWNRRTCRRRW